LFADVKVGQNTMYLQYFPSWGVFQHIGGRPFWYGYTQTYGYIQTYEYTQAYSYTGPGHILWWIH